MVTGYRSPGVYGAEEVRAPGPALPTGVPVFLGYAARGAPRTAVPLTLWEEFEIRFGEPLATGYLADAVRGFFDNGGTLSYVVRLRDDVEPVGELRSALEALGGLGDADLVCAPDIVRPRRRDPLPPARPDPERVARMQAAVLDHCDRAGDRLAILDSPPGVSAAGLVSHLGGAAAEGAPRGPSLQSAGGALYHPWVRPAGGRAGERRLVPPCGHVAGVYARTDRRVGVHKAPANEVLEGVVDLESDIGETEQGVLNPLGVNCLRVFPGRGIRVWGARTLSADPTWTYVSIRRLFLTSARWMERALSEATFEPANPALWGVVERTLTTYFIGLFRAGALAGRTPGEALYVRCDRTTNPPDERETGRVVAEVGLAPSRPNEFVVVHIVRDASGVTVTGPPRPQ